MSLANHRIILRLAAASGLLLCGCQGQEVSTEPPTAARASATTSVTVTATIPDSSARDTTIDIQVIGTGFDRGSAVTFLRDGVAEPKLRVNSTKYLKTTAVVASVTIAGDAPPDVYDVMVTTASGKKGIGTERFTVLSINLVAGANVFLSANAQGQAVGMGCDSNKGRACRPVVWNGGKAVVLPTPAGSCGGRASAINAAGVIAGRSSDCTVATPLRWTPTAGGGYTMQALQRPAGSTNYFLYDINGQGTVAGSSYDPTLNRFSAVLWEAGAVRLLNSPLPDVGTSEATGITESGLVSGYVRRPGGFQPVVWLPDGSAVQLQIPDSASYGFTSVINDRGVVAGNVGVPAGYRAVIWWPDPSRANTWLPAQYLATTGNREVHGINNSDQIVGTADGLPFYWDPTRGAVTLAVASNRWGGDAYGLTEATAAFPRIFGRSTPPSNTGTNSTLGVWWPVP